MDEPKKPLIPWNPFVAIIFVVVLYFVSQFIGSLLLYLVPAALGFSADDIQNWLKSSTVAQFTYVLLIEAITVGGLLLFLRRYKAKLSDIGLKKPRFVDVGIGILAWPIYFIGFIIIVMIASSLLPGLNVNQEQELGFDNVIGPLALVLTFISLVVLPPLVEEILVRGFLFTSLRKKLKWFGAALVTSAVFAAAHLGASSEGPLYIAAIDTFILSMVLCYIREKTGSLWAGIVLHAIKNGVAFVSLFILGVA
jgi:membrane protease YdiL (CAAX protease family)